MAITTCTPNSAKKEFLDGVHLASHTYKAVLIKTGHGGTYDASTTGVGTPGSGTPSASNVGTDAMAASGTYAVAGLALTRNATVAGTTVNLDFDVTADPTGVTGSADGLIVYNDSVAGKPAIHVQLFSNAPVAATNGTFTVTITNLISISG